MALEDERPDPVAVRAERAVRATGGQGGRPGRGTESRRVLLSMGFLLPALVVLGALVVYPIFFSVYRSLYDRLGTTFVGLDNYRTMFSRPQTLTAIRNNAIWLVGPAIVTAVGLVLAVLAERIRWSTAFKVVLFMPMAISSLSAGVIWRIVYEEEPSRGVANAAIRTVVDVFRPPGPYPGARPTDERALTAAGGAFVTTRSFRPGQVAELGLVAIAPRLVPEEARAAAAPVSAPSDAIAGVVWLDFTPGGGGEKGRVDPAERGLPGVEVEAVRDGEVVGSAVTDAGGAFAVRGLPPGEYRLRLAAPNFREPWGGITWLGPTLVTPAIILAWIWMWTGFAVVTLGAGLAAIPRDVLEAARVDGASEFQVFRRVTIPLLIPVVLVILVTLIINVLKIFDLIFVIAPGSVQDDANVIALEMWRQAFGGVNDQGMGSALALFLFVLVLPAMAFNYRRFKAGT